jgi:uncharacterized membrane protein
MKNKNMVKKLIQQIIIPLFVTGVVILIGLLLGAEQHYGSPAIRETMEVFLIFILPIFPIIYGIITRDKIGAILMGVLPFLGLFISVISAEVSRYPSSIIGWLIGAILSCIVLTTIVGLEGYFAAKRKLLFAIGLYALFIMLLLSGIH